jgi:hypothetical protein
MSQPNSVLWSYHSTVLDGFYQSEVIVVAPSREDAVAAAVAAVIGFVDERIEEYFSFSFKVPPSAGEERGQTLMLDGDDDIYLDVRTRLILAVESEANERIEQVLSGALVMYHSG